MRAFPETGLVATVLVDVELAGYDDEDTTSASRAIIAVGSLAPVVRALVGIAEACQARRAPYAGQRATRRSRRWVLKPALRAGVPRRR
jgi:hypothetical protein